MKTADGGELRAVGLRHFSTHIRGPIVDTRESWFYNGWPDHRLQIHGRATVSGHLPNALNLSHRWWGTSTPTSCPAHTVEHVDCDSVPIADRVEQFVIREMGILRDQIIGIYGHRMASAPLDGIGNSLTAPIDPVAFVAGRLKAMGFADVVWIEDAFSNPELFLSCPNYKDLCPVDWVVRCLLKQTTAIGNREHFGESSAAVQSTQITDNDDLDDIIILEAGWDQEVQFQHSHIPSARYFDTKIIESSPFYNLPAPSDLFSALSLYFEPLGIELCSSNRPWIIIYARNTMAACRLAFALKYCGLTRVAVLDGGWASWLRYAGHMVESSTDKCMSLGNQLAVALERGEIKNRLSPRIGLFSPMNLLTPMTDHLVGIDEMKRIVMTIVESNPDCLSCEPERQPNSEDAFRVCCIESGEPLPVLTTMVNPLPVSIRSWGEFMGLRSGYSYIPQRGEIPGSTWGFAGSDADSMEMFRNPDGTMRSTLIIERRWHAKGISPRARVIFYCGTGWRASEAFWYAHVMGWKNIAIFDGGWYEWSSDPSNKVVIRCSGDT